MRGGFEIPYVFCMKNYMQAHIQAHIKMAAGVVSLKAGSYSMLSFTMTNISAATSECITEIFSFKPINSVNPGVDPKVSLSGICRGI